MPVSKDLSLEIGKTILKNNSIKDIQKKLERKDREEHPLPHSFSKQTELTNQAANQRVQALEKLGFSLSYLSGKKQIDDPEIFKGNIENFIGLAQVPVGIIGPLRINGLYANDDYFVPISTTEGALVASLNRGARIIGLSGGASTMCIYERISRAPGFVFEKLIDASTFILWCANHFEIMQEITSQTTSHGQLKNINSTIVGNHAYLILEYTTGDAAGQNMVTIASEAICQYIMKNCPIKPKHYFIESNLSGDKKATALSFLSVRGKKVISEAIIPRKIVEKYLRTTPEMIVEYGKMSYIAGVQSGSFGIQGHYANALAGIFLACGQDVACVSEASVGITRMELTENKDLYMSVNLPNLVVGTVGGGTRLPTQKECLSLLGCDKIGSAKQFAEICAATVLAGEISIIGALAGGYFSKAHEQYGRKK